MHLDILHTITLIHRSSLTYRAEHPLADDLSPIQYSYISHALRNPGQTQDAYARSFCVDKTTVAHQLVKLEKSNYLTRVPDPNDMRFRCVMPTEKAKALQAPMQETNEIISNAAFVGFSDSEIEELRRLTHKMFLNLAELTGNSIEE